VEIAMMRTRHIVSQETFASVAPIAGAALF
jgi:hypothetical protein